MPNQNYFEAREELKMAQCDLSLSYPTCKTEERLCKFSYSSWCPTCDKECPRRRSKSETNEPCRRKGREMKGAMKKCDWNQECENMELEFETKDIRYDSCRVRSNLCELPTTYITNNCQMMKLSNYPSEFVDNAEKSVRCYENSLKSNDNQYQNFGSMVERQERLSKLFPRIEESHRNINGIAQKIHPKFDSLKPHLSPVPSVPNYLESKKTPAVVKSNSKPPHDGRKYKPLPLLEASPPLNFIEPLQNRSPKSNELCITELKNRICDDFHNHNFSRGDCKLSGDLKLSSPKANFLKASQNMRTDSPNVHYDTCTFFNNKVDVIELRERYSHEVELLKEKLQELKNSTYDNHRIKPSSAPVRQDSSIKLPPLPLESSNGIKMDFKRIRQAGDDLTGAIPKIPLVASKQTEVVQIVPPIIQNKRDRLKSASKVSFKTKGKLAPVKLKKQQQQTQVKNKPLNNAVPSTTVPATNSNDSGDESDCSGSEDSDRECGNHLIESESIDDISTASSTKEQFPRLIHAIYSQTGAGDVKNWPVRPSLFPNIPPYLRFVSHATTPPQRLPTGNRYMKWKMSTITPILVRKTLINSGFRLVRSEFSRESNEWMGTWGKHMKSPMFKTLKDSQKLNHFPGSFHIGRKDRLWRNFQRLINKFGQKEFGFTPQTYVLPQDLKLLKQHWRNKNGSGDEKYIIKPPASARGTGIQVINRWSQLPKRMSLVVQEYISNPYLINGSKFDLRLYVLVTSFNPLRIYLYPDGLARFASVPYSDNVKDLKDRYMHLTNYSINKMSSQYTANEDANACKGHKWTLSKLWEYMEKKGIDTKALWKNLQQLVVKTLISGESSIVPLCRENMNSRYNCYELFGVDVLLDEHLRSWLLEVNISPSLHSQSPLDEHVKGPLVQSLFDLAQFHLPSRLGRPDTRMAPAFYDPKIYTTTLTKKERNKHNYFCQPERREDYLEEILLDLTGDDVRHLTQAEDELAAIGKFERIFPTAHTYKYLEFLDVRYYNRLFDAWEHKYEKNRQPGIKILQLLCEQRLHWKIAPPTILNKSSPNLNHGESRSPLLPSKEGQTEPISAAVTVTPLSPPPDVIKSSQVVVAPIKSSNIKNIYSALRLQSKSGRSMVLKPLPRSDYATKV